MAISEWFKKDKESIKSTPPAAKRAVPNGIWSKCASCNAIIYQKELFENKMVCTACGHHYQLTAPQRVEFLVDEGAFVETEANLVSKDPLKFRAKKSYPESLEKAKSATGLNEAIITGKGRIYDHEVCLGVMDFRFIGGSMGSVVGEKIVRLIDLAVNEQLPLVIITASGGARMQEGMYSLLQMAKTSAAVARFSQTGQPFVCILTNPTTGGVTASFATLADIIIAEPQALIGFTGPRVIEQTIRQKLPKDFQSSESMLKHGLIDMVVPRPKLKKTLSQILDFLVVRPKALAADQK